MGSSNILLWDPSFVNAENDTLYAADSQRSGGAPNGVAFPSATGNKLFCQVSSIAYAIAEFLAGKGFTVVDSNPANIVSALNSLFANIPGRGPLQSLSYSSTQALNVANYLGFQIPLSVSTPTILTVSGQQVGDEIVLIFVQDSSGGNTVTFPSSFHGAVQPDPTPNAISAQAFKVDAASDFIAISSSNTGGFGSCTRTNQTGVYVPGITYTNSTSSAKFEEVCMIGPENDNTGRSYSIRATVNGTPGVVSSITNYSYGYASVGFWVPAGSTFSVSLTQDTGGTVYPPPSIYSWFEVSF